MIRILSSSVPASRAEAIPGYPSSAGTTKPESSASTGFCRNSKYFSAFSLAFSAKVVPVSSTRGAPAKSRSERKGMPVAPSAVRTSKNLFSFVVAKTRRLPSNRWELLHEPFIDNSFENFLLLLNQVLDAPVGETKHFLELSLAERAFFRGPLNFDKPAA